MKKFLSLLLSLVLVCVLSACGDNQGKSIIGKWYAENGCYLEILSDNTYQRHTVSEYGTDKIQYGGEWRFLEEEGFYKFYNNNDDSFIKIEIKYDKFGTYIEYGNYYGEFYKNKFPDALVSTIECPEFIGMSVEEVEKNKYNETFNIVFKYANNNEYPTNQICEQSEKAGKKLKKNATITLTVSMGGDTRTVHDVYGKTESYAISTLQSHGFSCVIKEIFDDEVEAGLVVKTEPARTVVVTEGTVITVYISKGKQ